MIDTLNYLRKIDINNPKKVFLYCLHIHCFEVNEDDTMIYFSYDNIFNEVNLNELEKNSIEGDSTPNNWSIEVSQKIIAFRLLQKNKKIFLRTET